MINLSMNERYTKRRSMGSGFAAIFVSFVRVGGCGGGGGGGRVRGFGGSNFVVSRFLLLGAVDHILKLGGIVFWPLLHTFDEGGFLGLLIAVLGVHQIEQREIG
jgi:hypothetical protein